MITDFEKHVKSGEFEKNILKELGDDDLLGRFNREEARAKVSTR
jgi:hypothetical protein